jgi:hypothetical protein
MTNDTWNSTLSTVGPWCNTCVRTLGTSPQALHLLIPNPFFLTTLCARPLRDGSLCEGSVGETTSELLQQFAQGAAYESAVQLHSVRVCPCSWARREVGCKLTAERGTLFA